MAACYVSVPPVSVQAQSRSPGPSTSTPGLSDQNSTPDLSDQKLNAAAAALERVAALQNEYKERVAEAVAPVEKERLVSEANNQLTKAVTDQASRLKNTSQFWMWRGAILRFGVKVFGVFGRRTSRSASGPSSRTQQKRSAL